jgi:hypothetical protein
VTKTPFYAPYFGMAEPSISPVRLSRTLAGNGKARWILGEVDGGQEIGHMAPTLVRRPTTHCSPRSDLIAGPAQDDHSFLIDNWPSVATRAVYTDSGASAVATIRTRQRSP